MTKYSGSDPNDLPPRGAVLMLRCMGFVLHVIMQRSSMLTVVNTFCCRLKQMLELPGVRKVASQPTKEVIQIITKPITGKCVAGTYRTFKLLSKSGV